MKALSLVTVGLWAWLSKVDITHVPFQPARAGTGRRLAALELLPCLPEPGKIICLGVNCLDHAKDSGNTVADYPALLLRCSSKRMARRCG